MMTVHVVVVAVRPAEMTAVNELFCCGHTGATTCSHSDDDREGGSGGVARCRSAMKRSCSWAIFS
jgi:hypothetical protein